MTLDEIERLEAVRDEVMAPLDEMNRQIAIEGDLAAASPKPGALAMRYERDAWKRYREAMKVLQSPTPKPMPVAPIPPTVAARPQPVERERNEANSFREERRLLLDQASAILASYTGLPRPTDEDEEAEWLEETERRLHAPATERSHL